MISSKGGSGEVRVCVFGGVTAVCPADSLPDETDTYLRVLAELPRQDCLDNKDSESVLLGNI